MNEEIMRAERIALCDATGQARAIITAIGPNGVTGLSVLGADEKPRIAAGVNKGGQPSVALAEDGGKVRIAGTTNADGAAVLFVAGQDGIPRIELATDRAGLLGCLRLYGTDGRDVLTLGVAGNRGFLSLRDTHGDAVDLDGDQLKTLLDKL